MTESAKQYLICLNNEGYAASLETRKIYEALPDEDADKRGLVRVIDESGEDYLFPKARFARIDLPRAIEQALAASG
jgi:hypothetical protein